MVKSSGYLKLTGGPYGKNQASLSNQVTNFLPVMTKGSEDINLDQEKSTDTSDQNLSPNEENFVVALRPEKGLNKLPLRRNPENVVNVSKSDQGVTFSKLPEKPTIDGFKWRKYGQKLVRGNAFVRGYYKCTYANCQAKKQVERSHDGHITEINYLSKHEHPKPYHPSFTSETVSEDCVEVAVLQSNEIDSEVNSNSPDPKRQKKESESVVMKTNYNPRVVVETTSAVDIVNDGYRWRKYGQKMVKGSPNPRNYYRCTNVGCPVKKHVERAARDEKVVVTTYEGRHDHDMPSSMTTITHNIKGKNNDTMPDDDDEITGMEMVVYAP